MWHIYTIEHYSALKRNEVLVHAAAWMNPESMKEASHQGPHAVLFRSYEGKFTEMENRLVVA